MIFRFVEVLAHVDQGVWVVSIKDGIPTEPLPAIRMTIAATRDVVAGEDKLKIFVIGRTKESGCRRIVLIAVLVQKHLLIHGILIRFAMQGIKYLLDQRLLFLIKGCGDPMVRMDVPPVAHVTSARVIGWQAHAFTLLGSETFVELHR
jgi:hypothetical protein